MPQTNEWWLTAAKDQILTEIKHTCDTLEGEVSTNQLVEILFPDLTARGAGIDRRQMLFARLQSSATKELAAYASRGEPVQGRFGQRRPWRWHKPKGACPLCGGSGTV